MARRTPLLALHVEPWWHKKSRVSDNPAEHFRIHVSSNVVREEYMWLLTELLCGALPDHLGRAC